MIDERCGIARIEGNHLQKALSWHVVVSSPQHCEHTAFSPAFPLVEFMAEAFCRLSLWNFKEKSINHFLEHSLFFLREQALGRVVIFWLCSS
ncbi:hypothetical protein [Bilophila sp.]|uniref:hypothetical protein n=1 Tax=Bilophila sp. TaxID=1929485 RepID=UPI003076DE7E